MKAKADKIRETAARRREVKAEALAAGLERAAVHFLEGSREILDAGHSRREAVEAAGVILAEIRVILSELEKATAKEVRNA
jgi:hypothetical protein